MAFFNFLKYFMISLIFVLLFLILFLALPFRSSGEVVVSRETCTNPNNIYSIDYEACYDAFSKNIYLEFRNNNYLDYSQTTIKVYFFDFSKKVFEFPFPLQGSSRFYKLPALKNPIFIEVFIEDNKANFCDIPIDIFLDFCPINLSYVNASLKLITEQFADSFFNLTPIIGTDDLLIELVDPESVWTPDCRSNWQCDSWGYCFDGYQKRECIDLNNCSIPIAVPERVRKCNVLCKENWRCSWSECQDGYTYPTCVDLNNCGTDLDKPSRAACIKRCVPEISCGDWSDCFTDYSFLTILNKEYSLSGVKTRPCIDTKNCVKDYLEKKDCSLVVDIYTKTFLKCGKEYIGLYNSLDDKFLASIEKIDESEIVNINLLFKDTALYCDHCFDGILNYDEEGIDCGGSCPPCEDRIVHTPPRTDRFFKKIIDRFINFLR